MTFNKHQYYLKNRERLLTQSKKWNKEHKDKMKESRKRWRLNHPEWEMKHYWANREQMLESMRKWKKENPEWSKEYYRKNREAILAYGKQWKKDNPEKSKATNRRSRIKHSDKNRERANRWARENKEYVLHNAKLQKYKRRKAVGSHTLQEWNNLKEFYKYTCQGCGKSEPEIKLTEDHIIPLNKGGTNYISNIQPLCKSCNCSKKDNLNWHLQRLNEKTPQGEATVRTTPITKKKA